MFYSSMSLMKGVDDVNMHKIDPHPFLIFGIDFQQQSQLPVAESDIHYGIIGGTTLKILQRLICD